MTSPLRSCVHASSAYDSQCAICRKVAFEAHNDVSGPLNLDCMPDIDLREVVTHERVHPEVRTYARIILEARKQRLEGRIDLAQRLEARAEVTYSTLIPRKFRW